MVLSSLARLFGDEDVNLNRRRIRCVIAKAFYVALQYIIHAAIQPCVNCSLPSQIMSRHVKALPPSGPIPVGVIR